MCELPTISTSQNKENAKAVPVDCQIIDRRDGIMRNNEQDASVLSYSTLILFPTSTAYNAMTKQHYKQYLTKQTNYMLLDDTGLEENQKGRIRKHQTLLIVSGKYIMKSAAMAERPWRKFSKNPNPIPSLSKLLECPPSNHHMNENSCRQTKSHLLFLIKLHYLNIVFNCQTLYSFSVTNVQLL